MATQHRQGSQTDTKLWEQLLQISAAVTTALQPLITNHHEEPSASAGPDPTFRQQDNKLQCACFVFFPHWFRFCEGVLTSQCNMARWPPKGGEHRVALATHSSVPLHLARHSSVPLHPARHSSVPLHLARHTSSQTQFCTFTSGQTHFCTFRPIQTPFCTFRATQLNLQHY